MTILFIGVNGRKAIESALEMGVLNIAVPLYKMRGATRRTACSVPGMLLVYSYNEQVPDDMCSVREVYSLYPRSNDPIYWMDSYPDETVYERLLVFPSRQSKRMGSRMLGDKESLYEAIGWTRVVDFVTPTPELLERRMGIIVFTPRNSDRRMVWIGDTVSFDVGEESYRDYGFDEHYDAVQDWIGNYVYPLFRDYGLLEGNFILS